MTLSSTMRGLEVRVTRTQPKTWILGLGGELNALTAPAFVGAGNAIPKDGRAEIDATGLTFCDLAGIRAILTFAQSRQIRPVTVRDPYRSLSLLLDDIDVPGLLAVRRSEN